MRFLARARTALRAIAGYDASRSTTRRTAPGTLIKSEDNELTSGDRKRLQVAARDARRNFSVARWAIAKHLDYVSTFGFQATTGDDRIDEQLESLMRTWSRPLNCDAAGRHSLQRMVRLLEAARTVDGDAFLIKTRAGYLQAIESDRVRTPTTADLTATGINPGRVIQGVVTDAPDGPGYATGYCVHHRSDSGQYVFDRVVPSPSVLAHGHYDRFDQVRGVSPLASAINSLRDLYEGLDYALAKAKVAQMFGLVLYRDAVDAAAPVEAVDDSPRYNIDFGKGPILLDLDAGDRAEFLENKTPSPEFTEFTQIVTGIAIKALDIPYSFYDESFTNYSGARQALLQYEQSAKTKRDEVQAILDRITTWRIALWVADGTLQLPGATTIGDLSWEWIPAGIPWIDPLKEVNAEIAAIGAGLDNPEDIARRHGRDVYANLDKTSRVRRYAEAIGLNLTSAPDQSNATAATDTNDQPNTRRSDQP